MNVSFLLCICLPWSLHLCSSVCLCVSFYFCVVVVFRMLPGIVDIGAELYVSFALCFSCVLLALVFAFVFLLVCVLLFLCCTV